MKTDGSGDETYYLIERPEDLDGWEVLGVERWKPGVKRIYLRNIQSTLVEFRMAYGADTAIPLPVDEIPT